MITIPTPKELELMRQYCAAVAEVGKVIDEIAALDISFPLHLSEDRAPSLSPEQLHALVEDARRASEHIFSLTVPKSPDHPH